MLDLEDTIDKVKKASNIVDVIGEFVALKKAGINYKGVCPFHNDHTPSMMVSPVRQSFKCFVCGKGGDVFTFLQEHENMTFLEALEWLCKKYDIKMPKRQMTDEELERSKQREALHIAIGAAASFYRDRLSEASSFLSQRGYDDLSIQVLADYGVGYAPAGNVAMDSLVKSGYNIDRLKDVGVVAVSDRGPYDVFRDRVMFPFYDLRGQIVGFSGRLVTPRENAGKYVNTGETPLFTKGHNLYGLYQAKKHIAKAGFAYLVEGQFDVLSLARYGVRNVIGGSGTAFTDDQVNLIMRFTDKVVMIYDADAAGIKAALKNTELLLKAGCSVRVARLPKGKDPDEFARDNGDNTAKLLDDYTESFPKAFKKLLIPHGCKDENVISEKRNEIMRLVSCVQDAGLRHEYLKAMARDYGVKSSVLEEQLRGLRSKVTAALQQGSMQSGIYGTEVLSEKLEDDQPAILTCSLQDFMDQFDESPIVLIAGVPSDADVLTLRKAYGYFVADEKGAHVGDDGSESDYLCALAMLFRSGVTRIDVSCGDHTETFLDFYINCHRRILDTYNGDKVPLVTRCVALTAFVEETVVTINRTQYCKALGLTKGEFDDIRKPFVQQRKSQQKVSSMSDGLDDGEDYYDPYNPPSYVTDNADYSQMWKEYQFYPRLNKKGNPVCYLFRNPQGGGMVQVGDFYMEPLLHIYNDDFEQNKRVIRVNRRKYETPVYIEVVSSKLLKMSTIEDVLINYEGINFSNGKEEFWRKIREWMSYRYVMCSEVEVYGNQQQDGSSRRPEEQFFAFANGICHIVGDEMKFDPIDELGVVTHQKKNYYLPAFSTIYIDNRRRQDKYQLISQFVYREVPKEKQISFDEWASLMDRVYSINNNGKWAVLFAVMSAFRSNIHCIDRLFTAPFFVGPMSSGKTQIAVSIRSLFVSPHQSIFNLNTGTDAAMQSYMSAFRDVPVVLDEYNNASISEVKFQALKSIVYDGEEKLKRKGSSGKEFETDKVFTPVILCGQEMPQRDDNALMSRVIICEVPKPKNRSQEASRLFEHLKDIEDPGKVGLSNVLMQVLKLRPLVMDHFRRLKQEAYDELRNGIVNSGETDRLMKTVSLFLATIKLLERYSDMHLPFTYEEFFRIARGKIDWQLSLIRSTDKLAMFFTAVNNMIDVGKVMERREFVIKQPRSISGKDADGNQRTFTFEPGQNIMFLRLQATYAIYDRNGYNSDRSSLATIEQNLRSHPSYIGFTQSHRFEWTEVIEEYDPAVDKVIKKEEPRRTITSAVIIDYDAFMQAYSIDFRREDQPDEQPQSTGPEKPEGAQEQSLWQKDGDVF